MGFGNRGGALLSLLLEKYKMLYPEILYKLLIVSIIPFLYIFLFGMMAYYFRDSIVTFLEGHTGVITFIYIIWFFIPERWTGMFQGPRYNVVTTLLLICAVLAIGFHFGRHRFKTDYSYAFYLYHMVVINVIRHMWIEKITSVIEFVIVFLVAILLTVFLGWLSVSQVDKKIGAKWQKNLLSLCR